MTDRQWRETLSLLYSFFNYPFKKKKDDDIWSKYFDFDFDLESWISFFLKVSPSNLLGEERVRKLVKLVFLANQENDYSEVN